ncbi:MAG: HAD family hydrolase [Eubacteriales bacterium]|nr:HAD family hydrolase [Eubacteriales bacterium]
MGKFEGVFIASDMDGTLLDDNLRIGAETIEALQYFTQQGGSFSLATGRTRPGTAAYRKQLPCNSTGVYLNGAIVCDEVKESIVYMEGLDDQAKELARTVMQKFPYIGIEVFLLDHSYVCNMCETTREHFVKLDIPYTVCAIDDIPEPTSEWGKINFTGEHEQVEEVRQFVDEWKDLYHLTFSTPIYYEMTCKGGHKGDGVRKAAEYLGIKPEMVCTVGDSQNDISMLQGAGICFAPQDARKEILNIVDVVVPDHNHNALAGVVAYLDSKF